jgi:DNA-binding IclR family transcriptional regulator
MKTYDRSAIMREANRLAREGMPRGEAMRAAWAAAKAAPLYAYPRQQQGGLKAALKRYGVDADTLAALAARAQETVKAMVAAMAVERPALLQPPAGKALDLKQGEDGVYRLN